MKKHGEAGGDSSEGRSREYRAWSHMKDRCTNPRCRSWPRYGARGIHVCPSWHESFPAFLADMGRCPPGRSLDRIDNDGPYEKANCRWATPSEQGLNTRKRRYSTLDGKPIAIGEMAHYLAMPVNDFGWRLRRLERRLRSDGHAYRT
jgi:hypothetical protein